MSKNIVVAYKLFISFILTVFSVSISIIFLADESQAHYIENVFNMLTNEGFLRGKGIFTLESVKKFYEIINEKPRSADLVIAGLLDMCPETTQGQHFHRPVIRAMKKGKTYTNAVALERYSRDKSLLTLQTIDSNAYNDGKKNGRTVLKCHISNEKEEQLEIGNQSQDDWSLASDECSYIELDSTKSNDFANLTFWNWRFKYKASGIIDFVSREVMTVYSARVKVTEKSEGDLDFDTEVNTAAKETLN